MDNVLKKVLLRPHTEMHPTLQSIQEVCRQMEALESQFSMHSDGDLIEACIYEMEALRAQYRFLLRRAREEGLTGAGQTLLWDHTNHN